MLRISTFLLIIICFVGCKNSSEKTISKISEEEKKEKYPHDFMFMQRAYPNGQLNTAAYSEAIEWKRQVANKGNATAIWEFSGPLNI